MVAYMPAMIWPAPSDTVPEKAAAVFTGRCSVAVRIGTAIRSLPAAIAYSVPVCVREVAAAAVGSAAVSTGSGVVVIHKATSVTVGGAAV